jgi:hypothetical protein
MPSRYICEIHDDIDEAIKKLRVDLVPGLCEEARVAGKRMEAKLHDYSNMKYDLERLKELKMKIKKLKATAEFIEAELDLEEIETEGDDQTLFERLMDEE